MGVLATGKVLLASGGMDSFLAWALFEQDALNVLVNIGHKYFAREKQALEDVARAVAESPGDKLPPFSRAVVDGAPIGKYETPSGIIPLRNAELILRAAQMGNIIVLGVLADEVNSDKSREFFSVMEDLLNICNRRQYWNLDYAPVYTVRSPLRTYTKTELVAMYIARGYPVAPLLATVSCYAGTELHCGRCASCFKRWVALRNNGLQQVFASDPSVSALAQECLTKARAGAYGDARTQEILTAYKQGNNNEQGISNSRTTGAQG